MPLVVCMAGLELWTQLRCNHVYVAPLSTLMQFCGVINNNYVN